MRNVSETLMSDWIGYWDLQWKNMPMWVYESGLTILLVGSVVCFWIWGLRQGWRYCAGLLLIEYVLLIGCSLVFFRLIKEIRAFDITPFRSYSRPDLFVESIMNVVLFLPIGLLLGVVFRSLSWKKALLIGVCLSVGIEMMQFVFKKGLAEFDDVMHNTAGCLIGYGVYRIIMKGPSFGVEK